VGTTEATGIGDALADVPILAGLAEEMRASLVEGGEWLDLRAGQWLFRAGDPGDALYILASGRLVALAEDPPEVLREIGRGDTIGELALLTGSPRAASVRAKRDSRLLRISRSQFDLLLEDRGFSNALLRGLGSQLAASRPRSAPPPASTVIAIVAVDRAAPMSAITSGIADRMGPHGRVATLGPDNSTGAGPGEASREAFAFRLDGCERTNDVVLLSVPDGSEDAWGAFAVDQADRVILVTGSRAPEIRESLPAKSDLLLYGEADRVPDGFAPGASYRVLAEGESFERGLDRVARRLSERSVGVVLSGGGARGFAHIGALQALQEAGVEIDRIGGCSMGALIGALYASGHSIPEILQICRREMVERNPMNDYTLPVSGLIRRHKGAAMLRRMFGEHQIEGLPLAYFCVSADLLDGELFIHETEDLFRAVGASICLPGVSPPVPHAGRLLVDGGLLDNLPVETMATKREGPVIAVDVRGRYQRKTAAPRRPRAQRMEARLRQVVIGEEIRLPSLKETLARTVVVGSVASVEAARRHAELVIEPDVSRFSLTAFGQLDAIAEAGRLATERSLEEGLTEGLVAGAPKALYR
jgi:predicted acylesterase/phospholipase RssA/CRP-like cAMP-binding protein